MNIYFYISPSSIALVSECGMQFHAMLKEASSRESSDSLPIPGPASEAIAFVRSTKKPLKELRDWLSQFDNVVLCGKVLPYGWEVLEELMGRHFGMEVIDLGSVARFFKENAAVNTGDSLEGALQIKEAFGRILKKAVRT